MYKINGAAIKRFATRFFQSRIWSAAPYLLVFTIVCGFIYLYLNARIFTGIRDLTFDLYQQTSPRPYTQVPVRIIDIDEESLSQFGQWPWPRDTVAQLVNQLQHAGAASIAFDIVFAEPDRASPKRVIARALPGPEWDKAREAALDTDKVLADVIAQGRVVTGFVLAHDSKEDTLPVIKSAAGIAGDDPRKFLHHFETAIKSLDSFEAAAAGNAAFNFAPSADGVVRKAPAAFVMDDRLVPSLSIEALRVAQGATSPWGLKSTGASSEQRVGGSQGITHVRAGTIQAPTDPRGELLIHHTGDVPDRYISAHKVINSDFDANLVRGHIVFIGTSAAGLYDLRFTPLGEAIPGVSLHAQVAEQILLQHFLLRPDWAVGAELITALLASASLMVLTVFVGAAWAGLMGLLTISGAVGLSWYAFSVEKWLFDPVLPTTATLLAFLLTIVWRYYRREKEGAYLRAAFSSYVSPNFVDELVRNPKQLQLGGERREMSFLFTDLAGFTSTIEKNDPKIIVPVLNQYLDEMIGVVFTHNGTLDKVVGDAITVMFSAPIAQPDHQQRAFDLALAMDDCSEQFRARMREDGFELGETRIGVNSGMATVGNFGGENFFDYTAHGDAINTAARLESINKQLGTRICITEKTVDRCSNFTGRPVGNLFLKGKTLGEFTYEPVPSKDMTTDRITDYLSAWEIMTDMTQDVATKLKLFEELKAAYPQDPLVMLHLGRLQRGEHGPDIVFTEK